MFLDFLRFFLAVFFFLVNPPKKASYVLQDPHRRGNVHPIVAMLHPHITFVPNLAHTTLLGLASPEPQRLLLITTIELPTDIGFE